MARRQDELLFKTDAVNGTVYYHHNALGSVVNLTNTSGVVVEKYKYDVFGRPAITDGSGNPLTASVYGNRFLFTGREWLTEVSLYDYRNRVYSADLGRFLQTDPMSFSAGDVNIYRYCGNCPCNYLDEMGLCDEDPPDFLTDLYDSIRDDISDTFNDGFTVQIGVSFNGQIGPVNVNLNFGIAADSSGNIGGYDTVVPGTGVGAGSGVSAGISAAVSNGASIADLAGPFAYASAGGGAGPNVSIDGFTGPGSQGQNVTGAGFTVGAGAGGGAATGGSMTYIHPFNQ